MIKNLILLSRNDDIDEVFNTIVSFIVPIPKIKSMFTTFYNRLKVKKLLAKNREEFKKNNVKILYIEDLERYKYQISQKEYLERIKELFIEGRKMLDYLMEQSKNYENNYRKIDIHMIYEYSSYFLARTIHLYQYVQIFLSHVKVENIYIPQHYELLYFFCRIHSKGKVNCYQYKNSRLQSILNRTVSKFNDKLVALTSIILKQKRSKNIIKDQVESISFSKKYINDINKPNIGFLYYSITHKRVGSDIFNFLKNEKYNVLEINPSPPQIYRIKKMIKRYGVKKKVLNELKKLYLDYIHKCSIPLFSGYLFELYNKRISKNIKEDFISIDYLYKILLENKVKVLILFNDSAGYGKIAAFLCKILNIKTLYIPHGGITDNILIIFPRWCDLMILNTEIEKEFLLNGKLDPSEYKDRLISLGSPYFQPTDLEKVIQIQDIYWEKKIQKLDNYKYKILIALGSRERFSNPKIIEDFIYAIKSMQENKDILLIIKLHPTDNINLYKSALKNIKEINYVVTHKMDIRNLIFSSDLFFTTPSTTILEGLLIEKPTIILDYYYYIMGYLYENPEVITTVHDGNEIKEQIVKILFDEKVRREYINSTYKFGTRFCEGSEKENFNEIFNNRLLSTVQKLLQE